MSSHSIHTQSNSARTMHLALLRPSDFSIKPGHRSGDRNCLHYLHHGRVAVMRQDQPIASHPAAN